MGTEEIERTPGQNYNCQVGYVISYLIFPGWYPMFSQIIGLFQFGAKEFHRILSK
jgi:hypothetical protein